MSETKCDDCGLPISVCNARAMLQFAIGRNGIDAVSDAIADLTTLSALQEQNRALREALDWAYSGDGLDECALMIDRMASPFFNQTEPCHATQIGVRKVLDAIRKRASTKQEGGE